MKIYQDLVHCPKDINLDLESVDHIIQLPTKMSEPVLYIELAALMLKLGHKNHAILLLKENYDRIKKYNYTGWESATINEIFFSHSSFEDWFKDYRTFVALGVFFRRNHNMFSSSEMYSMAASIVGWCITLLQYCDISRTNCIYIYVIQEINHLPVWMK